MNAEPVPISGSGGASGAWGAGRGDPAPADARQTRRRALRLAGGLAAAGLLPVAACAPPGSPAPPTSSGGVTQPASLVWLNWEGAVTSLEGNNQTVETFQAQFPQIKVENAAQSSGYWDKLSSLKASGTPPDLWEWEPKHVVDYAVRKQVLDLQPLVARDRFDLSDFFAKGVEQYRWKNALWGLPRDFPNRELLYSVTAFQKEGVPRPSSDWKRNDWTWEAFLEAARRLTRTDGSQWGFNTGRGFRNWAVWI